MMTTLEAALAHAARGWRVCPPGMKGWPVLASTNPEDIKRWWGEHPDEKRVSVATGVESRLVVLMVRDGGEETLAELTLAHGPLPETLTSTGTGRCLFFHSATAVPTLTGRLGPGLRLYGEKGTVPAPGSTSPSGDTVRFIDPEAVLAPVPDWLVDLARERHAPKKRPVEAVSVSSFAPVLAEEAKCRHYVPVGTALRLLLSFLAERGRWEGTPHDLGEVLRRRATAKEARKLPELGEWAAMLDKSRFHLVRFGFSFKPAEFSEFEPCRINPYFAGPSAQGQGAQLAGRMTMTGQESWRVELDGGEERSFPMPSDKVRRLLEEGDPTGLYRLEHWKFTGAVVAGLVAAGWTEGQVVTLAARGSLPGAAFLQQAFSGTRALRNAYQRHLGRRTNVSVRVCELRVLAERAHRFGGQAGATDWKVYVALLGIAQRVGGLTFQASTRQVAEEASIGACGPKAGLRTVRKSLRRLKMAGLLYEDADTDGENARRWRLADEEELMHKDDPNSPTGMYARTNGSDSVHHHLPGSLDEVEVVVWDRRGLGPNACRVWYELRSRNEPASVRELAEATRLSRNTVAAQLRRLDESYLAERVPAEGRWERWNVLHRDFFEVADALGVYGRDVFRKANFQAQRDLYLQLRSVLWGPFDASAPPNVDPETGELLEEYTRPEAA